MEPKKTPWYYQAWFLCLLFVLWQTYVTLIAGVILLILSIRHNKKRNHEISAMAEKLREVGDYEATKASFESDLEALDKRIAELTPEKERLESQILVAVGVLDYEAVNEKISETRNALIKEIDDLERDYFVKSVSIEAYENLKSDEVKNELQVLRMRQESMVKDNLAFSVKNLGRTKKEADTQKKQIMRCYNAETVSIVESVTVRNVDTCRNKLQRAFENLNKLYDSDGVSISDKYHKTKLEELSMVYAYMVKQEEEKELQREIRDQLKEEEKVRREIEAEKAKIEKEESQFQGEVTKLMGYMQKASEVEKQLYADKIRELEEKLKLLEKDKGNVLEREQNTRAGFVYIISNIGSFGENVYKIGMTRRLEPMDRVKELGDASVPFSFDVHAMIFSADAPALETTLHQTFRDYQINKVNPRKEFFRVDLDAVRKVVLENHNATVHFIEEPDAEQYRESLRMEVAVG